MELALRDNKLPIKAYPEEKLNEAVLMHFTPWLCRLLSITGETSTDRLEVALPAIKQHCWSFGFDEVTKMFEMYVDNKLGIEPRDNYFTRALFGKIVSAYKQQRPVKKSNIVISEISEAEKQIRVNQGVLRCYDEMKEAGIVDHGYTWVYDHLNELKAFEYSKLDKRNEMKSAKIRAKSEIDKSQPGAKNILEMLEAKNSPTVVNIAKRSLLLKYFQFIGREELKKILNDDN